MQWLNPWAWLGLLTLVLPVLVHLFSRRQTRVEPFPSLRFIHVSRLLPTRRTQLTDLLLLLVRLLIVATAVAALAQPLWRSHASTGAMAVAVIVDTTATIGGDSTSRATRIDGAVGEMLATATSQLRIDTDRPTDAIAGAVAWLATQSGQHQLAIASEFREGTLDSLDLALLPRDITVRLVPSGNSVGPTSARVASPIGAVWWAPESTTPADVRSAVAGAVRATGGAALADSLPLTASRVVVVAGPRADSLTTWLRNARPIASAWMGDIIVRLRADTTLVTAAAGVDVTDTALPPPFTVIARSAGGAPVVAATALVGPAGETGRDARLLLWTRAPSEALATAALLLGTSRAFEPEPVVRTGRVDTARLRRWERAPAAAPSVAASVRPSDALTGPSDARWLWAMVLVLLGIETLVRRRTTAADTAVATPHIVARDG